MACSIYLVEDDENLNKILSSYLEKQGWQVTSFLTGSGAQEAIGEEPDLWVLDIMLPDVDGYQLISEIKEYSPEIPVIFISARDADLDRIIGLEKGSDDYLAKPFMPRELVIRVQKILQRVYSEKKEESESIITYSSYFIDQGKRIVFQKENIKDQKEKIELTAKEFDLLVFLLENRQQALSRGQFLDTLWGKDYYGSDRVVDDLIRRLRKKLPELNLETIYGYGYRLVKP